MAEIQKPIPFRFRLFRLPILGDWLYHWHDQQELKKLNQEYSPLIQAAKQTKNEEALKLEENLYHKSRLIEDAAAGRNSEKLLAKARRWGVIPPIKSEKSNDWYRSNVTGDLILVPETEQRLRRDITEQVRGAIDEVRKNTTLVIAVLGFLLSCGLLVINVFTLRSNRRSHGEKCQKPVGRDAEAAGASAAALDKNYRNQSMGQWPGHARFPFQKIL